MGRSLALVSLSRFFVVSPGRRHKQSRFNQAALEGVTVNVTTLCSVLQVKNKQEKDLKVKTFAPPYVCRISCIFPLLNSQSQTSLSGLTPPVALSCRQAAQPELYLLPAVENESSVYSQSLSPETSSSSSDHRTYYPTKTWGLSAETKEPVKFPLIPLCSHPPPPTPSLDEEEEEEGDDDEESSSSSEAEDRCEEDTSINAPGWRENLCCSRKEQNHRTTNPVSHNKGSIPKANRALHQVSLTGTSSREHTDPSSSLTVLTLNCSCVLQ